MNPTIDTDILADALAARLATNNTELSASSHRAGMELLDENAVARLGALEAMPAPEELARYIDHTQLKPESSREDLQELCEQAKEHGFWSVCVNSSNVRMVSQLLRGSRTCVCAVVGFPLGAATPATKAFEAREAVRYGATEIDMVINIGALKSGDYHLVSSDIAAVVNAVPGKIVKVILECASLDEREKVIACALAKGAGAHFVKTSTGFGRGGATVEDIALMRSIVGPDVGVKASGGVRDYATAKAMIEAGASRLGCSSSIAIVTGAAATGDGY